MLNDEEKPAKCAVGEFAGRKRENCNSRLGKDRFRVAAPLSLMAITVISGQIGFNLLLTGPIVTFKVSTEHAVPWAGLRPMMPNMMPVVRRGKPGTCVL